MKNAQKAMCFIENIVAVVVVVVVMVIWDFEMQTNHLISIKRADLIIINKKKKKEN